MPLISICIPAYKNANYLQRLLDSISIQTFTDFEVIVSDDSPDESVQGILNRYSFKIIYQKNKTPFGAPANWNAAILKASGKWIKLMHDDDWFVNENSLSIFANAIKKCGNTEFIFCDFYKVNIETKEKKLHTITGFEKMLLKLSPYNIFKYNFIGHPSVTLIKNNQKRWYDVDLKWVVDFEFYIYILLKSGFCLIEKPLINIGINPHQVTQEVFRNPLIEIPENLHLLKLYPKLLQNIYAYDYYWRFLRNLSIKKIEDLQVNGNQSSIPEGLKNMLFFQKRIPFSILKIGFFSKTCMFCSYLSNLKKHI